MLKITLSKVISRFYKSFDLPSPFVFNIQTDAVLSKLGRSAREHLEKTPPENRKKIVYFPGYQQSKFVALNDATIVMALQLRGADVIPVLSGLFYQNEDVVFGGVYNDNRFSKQYTYSKNENALFTSLLNTDPVSLTAFTDSNIEIEARKISESAIFEKRYTLAFEGFNVGEMAERLVCNMNNIPAMQNTPIHLNQFKWHIYNIIKLVGVSKKLLSTLEPQAVVSNVPFYYKWRIPFEVSQLLNIPFYSYTIGERKNTFAWSRNTNNFFDASPCWESFNKSGLYEKNQDVINASINDRTRGDISHISYLPERNDRHSRINDIKKSIDGRPTVIFPVNVLVDAAVFVPTKSFNSCMDMISQVVDYFKEHTEYVCLLKAHPAEAVWASTGTNVDSMHLHAALKKQKIDLPENVMFIDFDEELSSFTLYNIVQGLIAYTSSTCMEISWLGKRVISAHDSHYSCAGFAHIPNSSEDFFRELTDCLASENGAKPDPEIVRLSRTYYLLYYYFTQIDCRLVEGNDLDSIPAKLLYENIEELLPGNNEALDYICDSILNDKPIFGDDRWPPMTR